MTLLLARARQVGSEVAARHAESVDRDARFPREAFDALKQAKLLGIAVPRAQGGDGAPISDIVAVCHALGQHCGSTAMIFAMHQIQVACVVRHGQDSAWHRKLMERLAGEQLLLASATTEAGVGGDVRSSVCAVERKGKRFTLQKNASVISYGADADGILVTARRAADAPASDQSIVPVLKGEYTLERTSGWDTLGMRGTCSDGFVLRASGDIAQVLPTPYAEISAQTMLPTTHLTWAGVWLGIASDAVSRARAFIRAEARRKPGTTPSGAVRLAETVNLLQFMRANVVAATRDYQRAMEQAEALTALSFAVEMNNVKTGSAQMATQVINHALLVCGLAGYRNDGPYTVTRHLRDAHSAAVMINNDRILANSAGLLLALKDEPELFA
ncbi:MAG: acyl-CoA/acyl-ACP dehydrogenase [Alphaproteobacteria bacterium]|nr:acyl-CoA/acyl-ACP dehydrogenase [Alphaproteobacteria bacterium]